MSLFRGESDRPRSLSPSSVAEESLPGSPPSPPSPQAPPLPTAERYDEPDDASFQPSSPDVSVVSAASTDMKPQSWRRWTAPDRTIAASLENIESRDVAAHLYNTHHLKRRLRRPAQQNDVSKDWRAKDTWLKKGKELQYKDILTGDWETELMPPKQWSAWPLPPHRLRGGGLAAGTMEHDEHEWCVGSPVHRDSGETMREEILAVFLRSAKTTWMARQADQDLSFSEGKQPKKQPQSNKTTLFKSIAYSSETEGGQQTERIASAASHSDIERDSGDPRDSEALRSARKPGTEVRFLADDALAGRILGPSVNSLLSNIDHLAMAVQRNRLNHVGDRARGRSGSTSELPTDTESTAPPCRPSSSRHSSRNSRARSTSSASSRASISSTNSLAGKGAGLMDWSELLGVAAVSGWDPNAVERTAERCASLFGEGMGFRTLDEGSTGKQGLEYIPAMVGPVGETDPRHAAVPKRPHFTPGTLRCPHSDCSGSLRDHNGTNRLIDHMRRKHGYDPRTNDSDNEERTLGGVHVDGYLQPIWVKPGWLGHGRSKSQGVDPEATTRRRKRQKTASGSGVASAYDTQDEGEEAEEAGRMARVPVWERLDSVSQRLKPNQACTNCRQRKRPCDGGHPCRRCQRMGEESTCVAKVASSRACTNCKRSRKKCDLERPCGRCLERGEEDRCEDVR